MKIRWNLLFLCALLVMPLLATSIRLWVSVNDDVVSTMMLESESEKESSDKEESTTEKFQEKQYYLMVSTMDSMFNPIDNGPSNAHYHPPFFNGELDGDVLAPPPKNA